MAMAVSVRADDFHHPAAFALHEPRHDDPHDLPCTDDHFSFTLVGGFVPREYMFDMYLALAFGVSGVHRAPHRISCRGDPDRRYPWPVA